MYEIQMRVFVTGDFPISKIDDEAVLREAMDAAGAQVADVDGDVPMGEVTVKESKKGEPDA